MRVRTVFTSCLLLMVCSLSSFEQGDESKPQFIEVPFDFYRNEIIIEVKIYNQNPLHMTLDTGTDPSAVDLSVAKGLGLKLDRVGHQGTGSGSDKNLAYKTKLPGVELGALKIKSLDAVAIDLSKISKRMERSIDGVLGHSLLNHRIVQIDYPHRVVRFYSKSPFSESTSETNTTKRTVLSFRYSDNVLIDNVTVNGTKVVGNFDTGSNGAFALTPAAVSDLGLEEEASRARISSDIGYNGASENRIGTVNNVTIGGISVDRPTVVFWVKGTGRDKRSWSINIGNVFLKDFIVTIDYRSKLITLERS